MFLPFLVKSGLFGVNPDQFLPKRADADKNLKKKKMNKIGAQISRPSDIEFVWVVILVGVLAHFHVKPNLG